jgi:hypothetical protein
MLIDLGRIIGGPDEGDGLLGALLGLFAAGGLAAGAAGHGSFDGMAGSGVADGFGAAARAGATSEAGWAGRASSVVGDFFADFTFTDWYATYDFFNGDFGRKASQTWNALGKDVKEVVDAHSFMLHQLKSLGLTDLASQYAALGTNLPDETLLKSTYRALAQKLHPDSGLLRDDTMFKALNDSNNILGNAGKREAYQAAHQYHTADVAAMWEQATQRSAAWAEAMAREAQHARIKDGKLLTGASEAAQQGANWFSRMSHTQKGLLAFGTVAAVSVGVYYAMSRAEKQRKKPHAHPHHNTTLGHMPFPVLHRHRVEEERVAPTAAGVQR